MATPSAEPLTLRLSPVVRAAAAAAAKEERMSLNKFIEAQVARGLEERENARWRRGFERIAEEGADADFAFDAQSEVVLATEP